MAVAPYTNFEAHENQKQVLTCMIFQKHVCTKLCLRPTHPNRPGLARLLSHHYILFTISALSARPGTTHPPNFLRERVKKFRDGWGPSSPCECRGRCGPSAIARHASRGRSGTAPHFARPDLYAHPVRAKMPTWCVQGRRFAVP